MNGDPLASSTGRLATTPRKTRVLIVDDSRTVRGLIRLALESSDTITVVGDAQDPYEAREKIKELEPDVLTLDVEMPRMDGLSFLERLMRLRPMPVIMVSTRTTNNSDEAIRALSLGAVDCIDLAMFRKDESALVRLVEMAATARPRLAGATPASAPGSTFMWNGKLVLIGSSTGGVDALGTVLSAYPSDGPPTVIAQHMPESFLASFADRLDGLIAPSVRLVDRSLAVGQGNVMLGAGGSQHVVLKGGDARVRPHPDDGETYVPSVARLFESAQADASQIVAVMLTGMGSDGAHEMAELRQRGAHTIVQSGDTCVVDGMPRVARELGAAVEVVPLQEIGARILAATQRGTRT